MTKKDFQQKVNQLFANIEILRKCQTTGQTGIGGHTSIADNTMIAGQSGVLGSIKESGQKLMGTPAIPYKQYLRSYAVFKKGGK